MATSASSLSPFSLKDTYGRAYSFPTGRPAVLFFVKEDCPTCGVAMPLIEAAWRAFDAKVDVWAIGQEAAGNVILAERYALSIPMLDDSALAVSYGCGIEVVPTALLVDGDGRELRRIVGFDRAEWQDLHVEIARLAGAAVPEVDWEAFPKWRAGCGSRSVEPGIAERLEAEARGDRLRARRLTLGSAEDPFEFMFDRGLTDGLPVIPPTPERVMRMLSGTRRDPQDVVATVAPNMAPATVEKVAVNAVMAGCRREYLPVVIAALDAVCSWEFNIHGIMATTAGATPVIVVNGPIRQRIGMNMGGNALGQGNRANATIGRALKLVLRNVGGARPSEIERATLGGFGKYTACFAEWEERSHWEPLHVERGFPADENVVTVFGLEAGASQISDHRSRTARQLGTSFGLALRSCGHPKAYRYGEALLVVSPEHADTFARDGWSKADVRNRIQEVSALPIRELLCDEDCGEGLTLAALGLNNPTEEQLDQLVPKFREPENINIVVAGGEAGKFSAVFGGWLSGPTGSMSVSRKIEEMP